MRLIELFGQAVARQLSDDELAELNTAMTHQNNGSLDHTLSMVYTAVGPEKVQGTVTIGVEHLQPWGVTNGGVYCAMGESLASIAGFIAARGQANVMGMTNTTDFFRPTRVGDILIGEAIPVNLGRSTQSWEVRMTNQDGKLVARTNLRTAVVPVNPAAQA